MIIRTRMIPYELLINNLRLPPRFKDAKFSLSTLHIAIELRFMLHHMRVRRRKYAPCVLGGSHVPPHNAILLEGWYISDSSPKGQRRRPLDLTTLFLDGP